ncbi:MAG: type II toxin-antitoxin system VapC family toxin [Anaerolineales bacterium]|nr:type II toxin-antitoxin system VapC family toxin [Anaerolineales bacterium]
MNRVFIDTGVIIALINQRDHYHQQASELADRFEGYPVLVTDAVLLEIGNALSRSFKQEASQVIEYFLTSDEVEIIHLTPELFEKGFELNKKYQDKEWSLVDCISFVVMQEKEVNQVLAFDRHFIQMGFEVLD